MEIRQEDFERAIEVVYKRGIARKSELFVSDKEVKDTIADVYDLLKYEINASQCINAASTEVECWYCHKKYGKGHKCSICGREGR